MLRGYVAPLALAGVKVVGDFVDNYQRGLPSEMGLLNLFDPATGQPVAIIDAAGLTDMRTGAVTALGAKHLARKDSRVLGHIGARGTAYWNVRLLDQPVRLRRDPRALAPAGKPRRVRRSASRTTSASPSSRPTTGNRACAAPTSSSRRRACRSRSRCCAPSGSSRGAFVVPYGTMSAVELSLTDIMDKMVVDDWGQCKAGQFGSLRAHVEAGKLSERRCTRSWARSSPGASPAASATTRRSCSGTAACRCPTSRSARRCSTRRSAWASGRRLRYAMT